MSNRRLKGYKYENIAKEFFIKNKYKILDRNFTIRWGEIDLVVEKNKTIYFVEVKWVSYKTDFQDYISKKKLNSISKTAKHRVWKNESKEDMEYSFLLILIERNKILDCIEFHLS